MLVRTLELQTLNNYTLHALIAFTLSCIHEICIHCCTTYVIIEYVAMASSTYIYTKNSNFCLVLRSVAQCRSVMFSVISLYTFVSSNQFKLSKGEDGLTSPV